MAGHRAALLGQFTITLAILAGVTSLILRQSRAHGDDLVQDYVSAQACAVGDSPYAPLDDLRQRAGFPPRPAHVLVRHNPHPPGAALLTVPFASLEFDVALRAFQLTQCACLAGAWLLAYRLFTPPLPTWVWGLIGGCFALWAPFWQGLDWGQPVGVLALAGISLWGLARAERWGGFGLILGLACTVRPFFAIMCVVAMGWPWRGRFIALGGAVLGGLLPFAICRVWPWEWYRLASEAGGYAAEAGSLPGLLQLGTAGGIALYGLAAVTLAWCRWRGLATDATLACAMVGAMLVYPLAWFQYDVTLIGVTVWVAVEAYRSGNRLATWAVVAYLAFRCLPDITADPHAQGVLWVLGQAKGWAQFAARLLLLAGVVSVTRVTPVNGREPA